MEHDSHARNAAQRVTLDRGAERSGPSADEETPKRREFGAFVGRFKLGPEFFEPLSDEEVKAWGED